MRAHVCCYCCINYSLAIFRSLWISPIIPRQLMQAGMFTAWRVRANMPCVINRPHKSLTSDFYWPITHWVIEVWEGRLSCQRCHKASCAVVCGCDWMGMRKGRAEGPSPLCQADRALDSSPAMGWSTNISTLARVPQQRQVTCRTFRK